MSCLRDALLRRLFSIPATPEALGDSEEPEDFFPIESLPPKTLDKLIDLFDNGRDILNFSLASPTLYLQLKELKLEPLGMNLNMTTNGLSVDINFDKDRKVSIKMGDKTEMSEEQTLNGSEVTKGTRKFMFCDCPVSPNDLVCFVRDPKRSLKPLVEMMSRNYPTDSYQCVLIDTDLIRKSVTEFLEHVPVKPTQELMVQGEAITTDEVLILAKDFKVQKKLVISDNMEGSVEEFKSLRIPILFLKDAPWLTPDHLINTTHQIIIANETTFKTDQLLKFVEWWFTSTNDTLKYVMLFHKSPEYDWFPIVNSLKAVSWDPRHRDGNYVMEEGILPYKLVNCQKGYDLWRRDTIATLLFNDLFFGFFVWDDRYPSRN